MRNKKMAQVLLSAVLCGALLSGCGTEEAKGTPAVKINDDTLTQETIDRRFEQTCAVYGIAPADNQDLKPGLVEGLIDEVLLLQEADRRGLRASDEEVQTLMDDVIKDYASEEEFEKSLNERLKMTKEEFAEMARQQVIFNELLAQQTEGQTIDARAYYDQFPEQFVTPEQLKASHILVATEEEARDLIAQLDNGADFAQLAQEHSLDSSAADGGNLGYFSRGRMVEPFENAAFALEVGQYTAEPVQSQFGYHIILLTDHKEAAQASFEEVEANIESALRYQLEQEAYVKLLDELRASAEIDYLIDQQPPADDAANNAEDENKATEDSGADKDAAADEA